EKYRTYIDQSPEAIFITDDNGNYVDVNKTACSMLGYTREELLSLSISEINVMDNPEDTASHFQNLKNAGSLRMEINIKKKNGDSLPIELNAILLSNGRYMAFCSDITERKKVEYELIKAKEKAEESDRLKTSFLQNMSHEIRTPMNAIAGFSSLLITSFQDKAKLEKFAGIINQRCADLLEIINDILDIAKIESGVLPVNFEEFSIKDLFADLYALFIEYQKRIGKQDIQFRLNDSCYPQATEIYTDKIKLKQIFINLISNAFKFTAEGEIEFGCKYDKNHSILYYVADTGIGIPIDRQKLIFERFVQLNQDLPYNAGGTGLGLSIVKGMLQLLGGKIYLESAPGKGSTFYFTLGQNVKESR
ncbi:MAG: ATP-binding protein, partial [Methanobacterium sp.]